MAAAVSLSRPQSSLIVEEGSAKMADQWPITSKYELVLRKGWSARSTPSILEEEDPVRRALRKKKHVIATELHLTLADLVDMATQNVITQEMLTSLKTVESNVDKVNHLVDFALADMTKDQLDAFLDYLRRQLGDGYDDIEAEIIMESGLLIIEDAVRMDASAAVHRCFGSSKRFSESDKRNLTEVLASKMQMTKLLWKARMSKLLEEHQASKRTQSQWNGVLSNIHKEIERFLRRNEFALFDFSVDMKSTTQALMVENSDEDKMEKLAEKTSYVLHKFGQSLMEKDTYVKDREKSLTLLKVKTKDPLQTVSNVLQKFMKENDKKMSHLNREIKTQKRRIKELENELNAKDIEIETMAKKLEDQQSELDTLKQRVRKLSDEQLTTEGASELLELPSIVKSEASKIVLEKKNSTLSTKSLPAKTVKNKSAGLKAGVVF